MAVFRNSRYTRTKAYARDSGALVFDIRTRNHFDSSKFVYYTVVQKDTLDGISYKHYDNAQLGWAIMDANPQYQSELEIKPGDVIAIPSYDEVVRIVG